MQSASFDLYWYFTELEHVLKSYVTQEKLSYALFYKWYFGS